MIRPLGAMSSVRFGQNVRTDEEISLLNQQLKQAAGNNDGSIELGKPVILGKKLVIIDRFKWGSEGPSQFKKILNYLWSLFVKPKA